jgi:peptidoglycan/LPS O-acetylase OafA/YrhL
METGMKNNSSMPAVAGMLVALFFGYGAQYHPSWATNVTSAVVLMLLAFGGIMIELNFRIKYVNTSMNDEGRRRMQSVSSFFLMCIAGAVLPFVQMMQINAGKLQHYVLGALGFIVCMYCIFIVLRRVREDGIVNKPLWYTE